MIESLLYIQHKIVTSCMWCACSGCVPAGGVGAQHSVPAVLPHGAAPPRGGADAGGSGGAAPGLHGTVATAQERPAVHGHHAARLGQALRVFHVAQLLRHLSHRETDGQYETRQQG